MTNPVTTAQSIVTRLESGEAVPKSEMDAAIRALDRVGADLGGRPRSQLLCWYPAVEKQQPKRK